MSASGLVCLCIPSFEEIAAGTREQQKPGVATFDQRQSGFQHRKAPACFSRCRHPLSVNATRPACAAACRRKELSIKYTHPQPVHNHRSCQRAGGASVVARCDHQALLLHTPSTMAMQNPATHTTKPWLTAACGRPHTRGLLLLPTPRRCQRRLLLLLLVEGPDRRKVSVLHRLCCCRPQLVVVS